MQTAAAIAARQRREREALAAGDSRQHAMGVTNPDDRIVRAILDSDEFAAAKREHALASQCLSKAAAREAFLRAVKPVFDKFQLRFSARKDDEQTSADAGDWAGRAAWTAALDIHHFSRPQTVARK
jgi:hypothetical protein